jgi:hypothetical protein
MLKRELKLNTQKDNLIIYVSSRNNYDMLQNEVFNNVNTEGYEFINVDDKSSENELIKGKEICRKNNIVFLENKDRGVQYATQTLIDFINANRPNCKWVICFQHDCYPISKDFFGRLSNIITKESLENVGTFGFNRIDYGKHTPGAVDAWKNGKKPIGMLGLAHLSILNDKRWLLPKSNPWIENDTRWKNPFSVEITAWTGVGINVKNWNQYVKPTSEHHFHLWMPDISMQFLKNNCHNVVLPNLYIMNQQEIKAKYGINPNSARGARTGQEYHFGNYSNFEAWQKTWNWHYSKPWESIDGIKNTHKGSLIFDFITHDIKKGPLKNFNFGDY